MTIPLDDITRKKLILVRQLFQHAILQAEAKHSYVDRIMALIGFDLTNETILKAIVSSINSSISLKNDFQGIVQQADNELSNASLPIVPDKARIQHVRTLRNDAQHKAKYPNETDISDCRTYTRDFLKQVIFNVWGESFDSISLTDAIQNIKIKDYLIEAENCLKSGEFLKATISAKAALIWAVESIEVSIVGHVPDGEYRPHPGFIEIDYSKGDLKHAYINLRNLMLIKAIGLELKDYIRFKNITEDIVVYFYADEDYGSNYTGNDLKSRDAEYVVEFAINAVLQIESLVGDINKPFEI